MDDGLALQIQEASRKLKEDPLKNFDPFYELTKNKVYFLILSYVRDYAEAEDLTQETFVRLLENMGRLRTQRNPLAFLMTVGKNLALDALRRRRKTVELDEDGVSEVVGLNDAPLDESGALLTAIKKILSPFEYRVYVLHVLSGLTFKEISKDVKRPIGTLTYTYSEAVDKLQKGLDAKWIANLNPA